MISQDEQLDGHTDSRERSCSSGSIISVASEMTRKPNRFESMDLTTLMKTASDLDISMFDRTRMFNPRKQRSCHKRAEPVSEEHRKMESSKNSREYTKRNRDEISTCRALFNDLNGVKCRFEELVAEYKPDVVETKVKGAVLNFEKILRKYLNVGINMKQRFNLPELDAYLVEYRDKATQAALYEHRPNSPNIHETKLRELKQQFDLLTNDKDTLNSSKDKTNFASSKSRLNQRIVREHLKSSCWDRWKEINTLTIQAKELRKHSNTLKCQVWDNILAVYYHLFGMCFQHRNQFDVQQIERMVEYFSPFSRIPGKLFMKWTPHRKPPPEVVTIDDDDDEIDTPMETQSPSPPPATEMKPDVVPPVERPQMMDMSQMVKPMVQDRMISTTQLTSPAVGSPLSTLAFPVLPAFFLPTQIPPTLLSPLPVKNEIVSPTPVNQPPSTVPTIQQALRKPPDVSNEMGKIKITPKQEIDTQSSRKRTAVSSTDESQVKKQPADHNEDFSNDIKPDVTQASNNYIAHPTPVQPVYPVPIYPATLATLPLQFNPLLAVPPGELAPFPTMTPNFLRAIEQQRVMGAFLRQAFDRCQK